MRVALIHDWLNGMRGAEKVLEALCELFPDAVIFTLFYEPDKVSKRISSHEVRASFLNYIPGMKRSYRNMLPLFPIAVERFDLSGFNLVISSSHCVAKGAKPAPDALHICFCHSPMRYVWDRFDDYFSDVGTGQLKRFLARAVCVNLRRWDVQSSERVDLFVANSEFVKRRVKKFYSRPSIVVYPFADTDFYKPASRPQNGLRMEIRRSGDYFLAVSALVPYKRIQDIVEAFREIDERVIIVGDGPEKKKLAEMAPANVEFIGWASEDTLLGLYRNCKAFIFPGVEDFGIVPVEAQACGKPVIALGEGGALETVDGPILGIDSDNRLDATGVLYRRHGPRNLADAIRKFESMNFDSATIRNNALRFSKQIFVRNMREFVSESYSRFEADGKAGLEEQMTARDLGELRISQATQAPQASQMSWNHHESR
jgi:glycosyltransferase involved in cell wall biosynthesis